MAFKALIVGAGNIGARYDAPDSKDILTHAHAYAAHKNFQIGGFVDSDAAKLRAAVKKWGGKAYASLDEALRSGYFDVVSVAVPTAFHFPVLKRLIEHSPRVIFAEKPFVLDRKEYQALMAVHSGANIAYCLNYRRRFVPEIRDLKRRIAKNSFGTLLAGAAYYGKGLVHNGTHQLDLLNFLIGDFTSAKILGGLADFSKSDPSYSVLLEYSGDAKIYLGAVDSRKLTVFELDLIFEKKRIRISDLGNRIDEFYVEKSARSSEYRFLRPSRSVTTGLSKALYSAVDNIRGYLTGAEDLICTEKDAAVLLEQLERILKKGKNL